MPLGKEEEPGRNWEVHMGGLGRSSPRETTLPYFSSIVSQYSSFCDGSSSPQSSCRDMAYHCGRLCCILTNYLKAQAGYRNLLCLLGLG